MPRNNIKCLFIGFLRMFKCTGTSRNRAIDKSDLIDQSPTMKGEHEESPSGSPISKKSSLNDGLVIIPTNVRCLVKNPLADHRRTGSTGTTGDESYTTDDDDDVDEPDITIKDHVTRGLYDISTIADKVTIDRNSSDSSMFSDKFVEELDKDRDSDAKSASGSEWSSTGVVQVGEQSYLRLQNELREANQELRLRDVELNRLNRLQRNVEAELEDLTASLFQEAHNMVREANEKQAAAEKALKESQMKVEVLSAEVAALKTLVLTSTPSSPNPHLHPQIGNGKDESGAKKHHRRSPSDFNLKYGRESPPAESPVKNSFCLASNIECKDGLEVDPVVHKEFLSWREKPVLEKSDPFVRRSYEEDIDLCLDFNNAELGGLVKKAVEAGTILIEFIGDKGKATFPKMCALLDVPRLCFYRMNIGENDDWYHISQICRNRIIAVCDFLNYLKYIEGGLVKSSSHDVYWEIVRLRRNMCLARLGFALS
ncbi:unnamed protein product [Phyllotreta striolata]|uniref:GDP/GTP exchange factor Sec2 N-terminal domain-containing protein n=1 Tax=Phyllotreta striolata TaxID=444603 RepID=A0A9N9TUY6_PHYSR|nr:unnamed protein product [Phyllotreta striolata]